MADLLFDKVFCAALKKYGPAPHFSNCVVYEISNVLSLFEDQQEAFEKKVSKKPPHPNVWAEWQESLDGELNVLGCWIDGEYPKINDVKAEIKSLGVTSEFDLAYGQVYVWCRKSVKNPQQVGRTAVMGDVWLGSDDDWSTVEFYKSTLSFHPSFAWPLFLAFSLLHCRNVSTETIEPEPRKSRELRHGLPPRTTYRTLCLEVPQDAVRKTLLSAEEEAERRQLRFHLCRGHFKNLQHERFKNKGWHWWPAHWKGNPELGKIVKDYRLLPKKPGEGR